jgi:hypothetical protein
MDYLKRLWILSIFCLNVNAQLPYGLTSTTLIASGTLWNANGDGSGNPALSRDSTLALAAGYQNLFGLGFVQTANLHSTFQALNYNMVCDIYFLQDSLFNAQYFVLNVPKNIMSNVYGGVGLVMAKAKVIGFTPQWDFAANLGLFVNVSDHWKLGSVFRHIFQSQQQMGRLDESLETSLSWSNRNLEINFGATKTAGFPLNGQVSIKLMPNQFISIYLGKQTFPSTYHLGFLVAIKNQEFLWGYQWHPQLPGSIGVSVKLSME